MINLPKSKVSYVDRYRNGPLAYPHMVQVRAVGVSNFKVEDIQAIIDATGVTPVRAHMVSLFFLLRLVRGIIRLQTKSRHTRYYLKTTWWHTPKRKTFISQRIVPWEATVSLSN